mmetsp:Transcript_5197/g.10690  ORF Transcript_5197/g.10690 Transcript_5197/m.10690 type:complete len:259 (-) Transcript_5197:374-1150(-)|eukprot:CAMPEP_0168735400 /NCGR_PEP_ID=MMETSP0724-20121128/9313_1 /TAXON_ID=265536 /ORGANISM="Amphiprora sp., Strain CCMP467" /LENGTH=258 /DNA_ID=CAMNT_0008782541 /DNA_START=187 /DNA_END=963 /DNA_ORIENTATION=+
MTVKADSPVVVDSSLSESNIPLPRFSLRKRKANTDKGAICLTSVNSAFLDGLFADVAEIQQKDEDSPAQATRAVEPVTENTAPPSKKSRSSLNRSISRCPKSFRSLGAAIFPSCSNLLSASCGASESPEDLTIQVSPDTTPRTSTKTLSHSKALNSCIKVPSFPTLPPAVSVSSCNTLTRTNSDLPSSIAENEEKDTYGWFVEMDDNEQEIVDPYNRCKSSSDLAFLAPTAPEAGNHDAEVQWAKAADTVDSVLGDFF